MNFRHVNPHNVRWLLPPWAADHWAFAAELEQLLGEFYRTHKKVRWDSKLPFWVDLRLGASPRMSIMVPGDDGAGYENCSMVFINGEGVSINLPLNDMLKGAPPADAMHQVYCHVINTVVPLQYIGITKQRWFDRLAQHRSAARNGSHLLFHRALREHPGIMKSSRVVVASISEEAALGIEENLVALGSLYPLGLNMIPGGRAGFAYLQKLGVQARNALERDDAVEGLVNAPASEGRANPLCAARWEADQDFVNRVICGHGARLTVAEIETIRALAAVGRTRSDIASAVGKDARRIREVITGTTYRRVR